MGTTLDTTALTAVLKTQYSQTRVNHLCYPDNPFYAMVKKRTDFLGANKVIAIRNAVPQGRGASISVASTNKASSVYNKFTVTRAKDYALANVDAEAVEASAKDAGALLAGLKAEIDGAIYVCMRSLAIAMFRNGGGARGQISSTSTVASQTITLANVTDITNFEVGMVLNSSATDGTTGAKRTGTVTVGSIDRDAGTITTTSGNWSAGITGCATGDYIFQNGDFEATNSMLKGLAGWIPTTAPTSGDSFFGLDRSTDVVRLAGVRYTAGAGGPIEEILIQTAARLAREGSRPDTAFLNPIDYANLVAALGTKVIYDRTKSFDAPDIGFESVKLMGPKGPIKVVADLNCPKGLGYMLQLDTWCLETLNGAPRILNLDGLQMLRNAASVGDSYEFRVGYYGNLTCEAPGWNAYLAL